MNAGPLLPVPAPAADMALVPDRALIDSIKKDVRLTDSAQIVTFGANAQREVASYADSILRGALVKDSGEIGVLIGDMLSKVKELDPDSMLGGSFVGRLFTSAARAVEKFRQRFQSLATQIDRIALDLERHQDGLKRDIAMLDGLHDRNLEHLRHLEAYIVAGSEMADEAKRTLIPAAERRIAEAGEGAAGQMAAQSLADLRQAIDRLERKVHDLKLSRVIALQTSPQIRLIQSGDAALAEKLQTSLSATIPIWKNQATIALALHRQDEALKMQRKVSDATNEMLTRNAEALRTGVTGIEKEVQRGIVDVETLAKANRTFIDTLNEVLAIQQDGRAKRRAAEDEMQRIEAELKQALIQEAGRT